MTSISLEGYERMEIISKPICEGNTQPGDEGAPCEWVDWNRMF